MTARCVAAATAVLTIVALGCIFALSVLSAEDDNDQRLRPLSSRRNFRGTKTIDQVRQSRPVAFMRNIVHRRGLSENKDSDIPANYGNKQGHQEPPLSLALVRPISVRDAEALVNSFVHWDEFVPGADKGCRFSKDNQSSSIDIIISFSREFDKQKYPDITAAMEAVHSLFEKTNGWGGCIQSIKTFEANICPEEDLYDPLLAEQGNRMWANGPNRYVSRVHVLSACWSIGRPTFRELIDIFIASIPKSKLLAHLLCFLSPNFSISQYAGNLKGPFDTRSPWINTMQCF